MLRRLPLYLVALPLDLPCWAAALLLRAFWGKRLFWRAGVLVLELRTGTWPERFARCVVHGWYGKTVVHAMMFREGKADDAQAIAHESHHVEQAEAACLAGAMLAPAIGWAWQVWPWWAVLVAAPAATAGAAYLAAMLTAVLRGEHHYYGNHLEEAAYAVDGE